MHKSVNEQLQIKKKRKPNNNNNKNNNNLYYTPYQQHFDLFTDKHSQIFNFPYGYDAATASFSTTEETIIITDIDAEVVVIEAANGCSKIKKLNNSCCLRDQQQQQQKSLRQKISEVKMPLSQAYLHCGISNSNSNNSSHTSGISDNMKNFSSNRNAAAATTKRRLFNVTGVDAKRKSSENKTRTHFIARNLAANQSSNSNSSNSNSNSNSKLQLSYLLGESLASCGRLQEAFDIYAIIAHDYLEGYVPLDRLNALATCMISYIQQQQLQQRQQQQQQFAAKESAAAETLANSNSENMLEPTLKVKFAKHLAATQRGNSNNWPTAAATATSTGLDPVFAANASLQLHAPTRELAGTVAGAAIVELGSDCDPLLCPLCQDILRCPVTTNCGHTFCRQCCETITQCNICQVKFPRTNFDEHVAALQQNDLASNVLQQQQFVANGGSSSSNLYATTTSTASSSSSSLPTTSSSAATATYFNAHSNVARSSSNSNSNLNFRLFSTAATVGTLRHHQQQQQQQQQQQYLTVTTTTVASTTATATTTMASSTSATAATRSAVAGTVDNMKFMPDVLVRRLVEKWWGPDLQAHKINETAASYMHLNLLDDALRFCNASLEKSPTNFKSLLLRAEVLRKLNHFQSSLADIDNALKSRYTSAKAHYQRSLALAELGRFDEALYNNCLAISLDKSTNLTMSELFQHDLAKLLQKLLAQVSKNKSACHRTFATNVPYSILAEHRFRRKKIGLLSNANGDHLSLCNDEEDFDYNKSYEEDMIVAEDEEEDLLVSVGGDGYLNTAGIYNNISKDYEQSLRHQNSRKHCRRKWATKETELMPSSTVYDGRCSELFRSILNRTQQEMQRLKKLESSETHQQRQLIQVSPNLIDASDFDCVLCCRTFWKPVVTPCGHTYCWVCLDRCMDYSSSCPLCMSPLIEPFNINAYPQGSSSPVPFVLAKRPVTKFLEAAMKRFIPDSYEKRFHQEMDMEPSVPVFICTTAFPHVPCPLFVYEPRYRLMVRRAVESGEKQFGIVQPHSGKSRYFDVGTILDIRDCVLLGDGCSILSTIGCKRFKILARSEKDGYETAKVEYIYDETIADENIPFVSNMHAVVLHKAIEWFESLSTELKQEILQSFGGMPSVEDNWERIADGPAWAWWIIALLPLPQQLKVDILATTSLEKRLRAIEKTLDYMTGTFRRAQQNCSVVVQQHQQHQHQQHQQHQQQQQQQDCDNELTSTEICQSDECCPLTTTTQLESSNDNHHHHHHHEHHHHHNHHHHNHHHHTNSGEQHTQLLL